MQTRRCPPRCLRAPSSGAVQSLLVPGAGCCGCCCGSPICLLCGFQACAELLCWPLHQFATATSEAPCQHACLPILVRPAGWRPAHAASLWLGMPRMPPSMSGQQVGSTCWRPLRHNVQTVQSQYQPASCHFCLCHSTESASLSDAALPCPADLSEVVTRVGLGETEVDMVDRGGVSGAGRAGVGVAEQCVLANAACTAHHEIERELTWPDLACRSSCPHAPHTSRRRRCPTRCPTSLCGAAGTRCCCSGRWVQLPADTACLSLQVPPDRIAAAVLGGAAGFVLCCHCPLLPLLPLPAFQSMQGLQFWRSHAPRSFRPAADPHCRV